MPNNGKLIHWDALEYSLKGSVSGSGSGAGLPIYQYSGTLNTAYTPNVIDVAVGIVLHVESQFDGYAGTWAASYDGPGAPYGGYNLSGSGFQETEIRVRYTNVRLYAKLTGTLLRLVWDAAEIYLNGSYIITLPGSNVDLTSAGVGPSYVPIIGLPPHLIGSATASRDAVPTFVYNRCSPGDFPPRSWHTVVSGAITGGMRFRERDSSEWVALPCKPWYPTAVPAAGSCPFGLDLTNVIGGSSCDAISINLLHDVQYDWTYEGRDHATQEVTVTCIKIDEGDPDTSWTYTVTPQCVDPCDDQIKPHYRDKYKLRERINAQNGSCYIVPDLTHRIFRHRPDYRLMWWRGTLPQVTGDVWHRCINDAVTGDAHDYPEIYPDVSQYLGVIGDGRHAMEDILIDYPTYSPTTGSITKSDQISWETHESGPCLCVDPANHCASCPAGCEITCVLVQASNIEDHNLYEHISYVFLNAVGADAGSYLWHADDFARWFNCWANRLWHYLHWRENWADISADEYWLPGRQQWLENASLPSGERTKTRTDIIGSCSNESGHTPFLDSFVGGLRWGGVSRFKTTTPTIPESKSTDASSAGLWGFGDFDPESNSWSGSGSVTDSYIEIAAGESKITLTDCLSFLSKPYLYPLICDRLRLSGSYVNVDSWQLFAVGVDGSRLLIADSFGDHSIGRAASTKFAGSWGVDNGISTLDDLGIDLTGDGISAATMADPARLAGFELLPSNAYHRLEWELTPTNPANAMRITHPTWLRSTQTPKIWWESGQICTLLWPDGQMIRLGNWIFFDPSLGLICPPLISGAGYKSTMIDALCIRRLVFEGKAFDDGLITELGDWVDDYEGPASPAVVDKFSVSYLLPKTTGFNAKMAMVNTMAEVPPMSCFPSRLYDSDWQLTNTYACHVWDWAQHNRYLISPGVAIDLYDPSDVKLTTDVIADVPAGWRVTSHTAIVDNTETVNYTIKSGSVGYAHVTPWRGFSAVIGKSSKGNVHLTNYLNNGVLIATICSDSGVEILRYDVAGLADRNTMLTTSADYAQSAVHPNSYLVTAVAADGEIKIYKSVNSGRSANLMSTITGDSCALAIDDKSGQIYALAYDAGTWKCYRKDNDISDFTLVGNVGSGDANTTAGIELSHDSARQLVAMYIDGGDLVTKRSLSNGESWW